MPLLAFLLLFFSAPTWAAHAYAQFGDVKYAPGFSHFAYVNPDAPKGGEIRMVPPTRPTNFDKFNPFTLKGTAPHGLAAVMIETLLVGNSEEPTTAYGLLADDVTVAENRLSATFRLHPGARFHHGKPVLAADVVHSFSMVTGKLAASQCLPR
jgi:microcin C transport system substrate-binding protein